MYGPGGQRHSPLHGRCLEDEGVTSGYSPRAHSLPHPQGCWPPDQIPSTPHKRVGQAQANEAPGTSDPFPAFSASSTSGQSARSGDVPTRRGIAVPSGSGMGAGGGVGGKTGVSGLGAVLGGGGIARFIASSLSNFGFGLWESNSKDKELLPRYKKKDTYMRGEKYPRGPVGVQESPDVAVKVTEVMRATSLPRSPTIIKGINSLAEMESLVEASTPIPEARWVLQGSRGVGVLNGGPDIQPWLPALLATAIIALWCLRSMPAPATTDWLYPSLIAAVGWIEFFLITFLLIACFLLARFAFPDFVLRLRMPDTWQATVSDLNLNLLGLDIRLGPVIRKGARYLHLARLNTGKLYGKAARKPSGYGASWRAVSGAEPPPQLSSASASCGVHTYSSGERYEGELWRGRCSGSGVYYFSLRGRYEGEWVDGKYDGYGVETWSQGSRYKGQYRQGLREGFGVYRFYTGDVYSGMWCQGQSHGVGVQMCADGSRYVGEFAWGVKHGCGKYLFRNGDVYSGEYFGERMHGFGVYRFATRHSYAGAWYEGRKQGLGVYIFSNGETRAGVWHRGALERRSTHSIPPTPDTQRSTTPHNAVSNTDVSAVSAVNAVNHTRVLHALQEARRAAAKADGVEGVEERVQKAVGAANRSAMAARVMAVKATQKGVKRHIVEP